MIAMKSLVFFLLLSSVAFGQSPDTTKRHTPQTWKKFEPGLRVAVGLQKYFYTELGLGLQRYTYIDKYGFLATTFYASYQWTPPRSGKLQVNGIKAGAELVNNGATGGIEVVYLYNDEHSDWIITPKYGFGIGAATLFYGYNFSTSKYPFPNVRRHQFSLAINTNILFFAKKYN